MSGDVVDLIMQDHREVERMFEELRSNRASRAGLVPVLTTLLTAHSRAEEAEVYPVARDEAEIAKKVEHSQAEHVKADQLLARLAESDPEAPEFDSVLEELVEAVTHHVEDEESELLPSMRDRLEEDRRRQLGDAFLASRQQHLGDQPGDIRKSELQQQARNVGLSGAAGRSKEDLHEELVQKAEGEESSEG